MSLNYQPYEMFTITSDHIWNWQDEYGEDFFDQGGEFVPSILKIIDHVLSSRSDLKEDLLRACNEECLNCISMKDYVPKRTLEEFRAFCIGKKEYILPTAHTLSRGDSPVGLFFDANSNEEEILELYYSFICEIVNSDEELNKEYVVLLETPRYGYKDPNDENPNIELHDHAIRFGLIDFD